MIFRIVKSMRREVTVFECEISDDLKVENYFKTPVRSWYKKQLYAMQLGAAICEAVKQGVPLDFANLRRADLRGADLRGGDFWGSDLRKANFTRADVRGVNFKMADLRGAIIGFGQFSGNDLEWANLRGIRYLDSHSHPVT